MLPECQYHESIAKQVKAILKTSFASLVSVQSSFIALWFAILPPFGDIIGCVGLTKENQIRCLAVAKQFRRHGIASKLIHALEYKSQGDLSLETIDLMTAALSLYQKLGYKICQRKHIQPKSQSKSAFYVLTLKKEEPVQYLIALPLLLIDAAIPKLRFDYVKPLENQISFRLPQPLYPRLGLVFQLGGRRYLACRDTRDSKAQVASSTLNSSKVNLPTRTIPAGSLVHCHLYPYADPVPSFPRKMNTFRREEWRDTHKSENTACAIGEPCSCNAECILA